jgi:hypothetical protein
VIVDDPGGRNFIQIAAALKAGIQCVCPGVKGLTVPFAAVFTRIFYVRKAYAMGTTFSWNRYYSLMQSVL